MRNLLFIPLFFLISVFSFSQPKDSLRIKKAFIVSSQSEEEFFPARSSYVMKDTSFYGVHRYFPGNFPYGLPLTAQRRSYQTSKSIGFRNGLEFYNLFGYTRSDIQYYHTRAPLTSITLVFGQKKEQFSRIFHTQNITKQWNVALNMLRIRGEGYYTRQNLMDNNISFATNFTTRNNRYAVLANGIITSLKTDENGGVINDTIYEANLFNDKKLIPVNLKKASSRRKNKEVTITQFLNFGKRVKYDANDTSGAKKVIPAHYFSYSFHADGTTAMYNDEGTSKLYKNFFYDKKITKDSTHVLTFEHTFSWNSLIAKNTFAKVSFDYKKSNLVQYARDSIMIKNTDTIFKNNTVGFRMGNIFADTNQRIFWGLGADIILSGNNKQDKIFTGSVKYLFDRNNSFSAAFLNKRCSPEFQYTRYLSNNFLWNKNFNFINETYFTLSYQHLKNKIKAGFTANVIKGYTYLDSTCTPVQSYLPVTINSVYVSKHFRVGKFNLDNTITYQFVSNKEVLRLPAINTFHSLYFQDRWFKKATLVQFGFDVRYFSSYYANAYMPALGLYYWQNKKQVGNYPFIDFFFAMKVKRAKVFFKVEHTNSGLMGAYYLAPHLPAPDRSIKIGINWDFFD